MSKRYALVKEGQIEGFCLWDGQSHWTPPNGFTAVLAEDAAGLPVKAEVESPEAAKERQDRTFAETIRAKLEPGGDALTAAELQRCVKWLVRRALNQ